MHLNNGLLLLIRDLYDLFLSAGLHPIDYMNQIRVNCLVWVRECLAEEIL